MSKRSIRIVTGCLFLFGLIFIGWKEIAIVGPASPNMQTAEIASDDTLINLATKANCSLLTVSSTTVTMSQLPVFGVWDTQPGIAIHRSEPSKRSDQQFLVVLNGPPLEYPSWRGPLQMTCTQNGLAIVAELTIPAVVYASLPPSLPEIELELAVHKWETWVGPLIKIEWVVYTSGGANASYDFVAPGVGGLPFATITFSAPIQ